MKERRCRPLFLASVLISLCIGTGTEGVAQPLSASATPNFVPLSDAVRQEIVTGHIPGAVVLVGENGGEAYRSAFGDRLRAPRPQAMTADTIFDLASLTKVVATTTAIMQLVEHHKLSLDDRVEKYWPEFAANGKDGITVYQLLTHTSGLRPDIDTREPWSGIQEAMARIVADRPLDPPGTKFRYSDVNFDVLGELVRRISGERLDAYSQKHIFAPLGMADTGFLPAMAKRGRIAPTDIERGALRWGEVQDPVAYRMGGVAGHAGLFSTADDLQKFVQMLLGSGARAGVRVLSPASVARMTSIHLLPGDIQRGLGWDIASPYAADMDLAFGPGSYGHTGYTGTSLWIDPVTRTYLILLTSRLYPDARGDVAPLRRELSRIVAETDRPRIVMTGIDVLAAERFAPLAGLRVGLLTNQTGRDSADRRTIDLLARAPRVRLVALFSPEHGPDGDKEGKIDSTRDARSGLPVYSLYGSTRRPTDAMLAELDGLVVDLQDAGTRYYTYPSTLAYLMEAAARRQLRVFVLDRPNPISAAGVRGPVLDSSLRSFTGYFPMPVQHGMTLGELAAMFNTEDQIMVDLTVIPMRGYRRESWFNDTGLKWTSPSPNLRSVDAAVLYPGVGMIEGTNISVGRGTDHPFELVGAPWIDGMQLAEYLRNRSLPDVIVEATEFTPAADRYAGQLCNGVHIDVTDRENFDAPRLGIELAAALHQLYPDHYQLKGMLGLLGSRELLDALESGEDPQTIASRWNPGVENFKTVRNDYLLYK